LILRYNLFTILWAAVILLTTLLPSAAMPPVSIWDFFSFDSFAHAAMFAVLTFLMIVGLKKQFSFPKLKHFSFRIAFTLSFLFGVGIEFMQHYLIAGRMGDIFDVLSNTIGCLLGIVLFKIIYVW
jgi:glycopeptide antibiotics resistance protein